MRGIASIACVASLLAGISVASATSTNVVDFNPAVRDGGFDSWAGNDNNTVTGLEFWSLNSNANAVTSAADQGLTGLGPAAPSQGSQFAIMFSTNDNGHAPAQADGKFRATPGPTPPFIGVTSVTLSFEYALTGTVGNNTNSDLVLFKSDNSDHFEVKTLLTDTADPTTWTPVVLTFNGPFVGDNPFSDIGQIRLDFNVVGTGSNDAVLSVDSVRLTFNTPDAVPEPASLGILGVSSLGLLLRRRTR